MIAFITYMHARPGKREELIALTRKMQEVTAGEDGVPIYVFHTSKEDPDDFWFYDLYESQEAYEAHCATPEFESTMGAFGELVDKVEATQLVPYGPVKGG